MNLFLYLQTFILNYSFIVILSDHIFLYILCFIKTQPSVKRKPVKTVEKKIPERSRSVLGRFYCTHCRFLESGTSIITNINMLLQHIP